jgi:hypothetical protein
MTKLTEVEYEKIFSPKTLATLKGKSGESLRSMLGNKSLRQTMMRSQEVLNDIIQAEEEYRDELDMVATQMVTDAYPIIDYANIRIDAKIVDMNDLDIDMGDGNNGEDPSLPDFGEDDPEKMKAKRRIINGITQGASIRGAFGFMLFKEYLDAINPELVNKYNEILKLAFGIYDDENAIAMLLAALAQGQKPQGGESEMEYDEENEQFVIKARAICYPMLVHEIVKGLYEIVGTEGFGADKEKNQAIVGAVDKLSNEPRDLQYGKFIYDAISALYNQSEINDPRVRELFFAELYKSSDDEFFPFIENAINDELTAAQKKWAKDTMKDIAKDLGKDDTGLEDLDEGFLGKTLTGILLATALLGGPSAKAQDPTTFEKAKGLFKNVAAQVQSKLQKQPKVNTVTIKQDAPLRLSKFKNDSTVGYGYAESPDESVAKKQATLFASANLAKKLGKQEIVAGFEVTDVAHYMDNGKHIFEVTVKLGQVY